MSHVRHIHIAGMLTQIEEKSIEAKFVCENKINNNPKSCARFVAKTQKIEYLLNFISCPRFKLTFNAVNFLDNCVSMNSKL